VWFPVRLTFSVDSRSHGFCCLVVRATYCMCGAASIPDHIAGFLRLGSACSYPLERSMSLAQAEAYNASFVVGQLFMRAVDVLQ
jgi:hypothetical protein